MNVGKYLICSVLLVACTPDAPPQSDAVQRPPAAELVAAAPAAAPDAIERGPHAGRLLRSGDFAIELCIFESGIPPEFHVYGYLGDQPLAPELFEVDVTLVRLGGVAERYAFTRVGDFLRGQGTVAEPHSFDVTVKARHAQTDHQWTFQSYEGRIEIPPETAQIMGLAVAKAGPAKVQEELALGGVVRGANGVHAEFDAYGADRSRLRVGQAVELEAVVGNLRGDGVIRTLTPRVVADKPAVRAQLELNEPASKWPPGQFVRAHVTTATHAVPLAVQTSALQRFRDFDVVFARVGDLYEVRMLQIGRSGREWTEVLKGLAADETYVTENSFLVGAQLQKVDGGHAH